MLFVISNDANVQRCNLLTHQLGQQESSMVLAAGNGGQGKGSPRFLPMTGAVQQCQLGSENSRRM